MPNRMRSSRNSRPGTLRIIGGKWRGRRFEVSDQAGLRPTPDRVRETLFNWLQPTIAGARCLDLFAGSGALALEALSRGAAEVVAVEHNPTAHQMLRAATARLEATGLVALQADALAFLAGSPQPFDVVFVDPPFDSDLLIHVPELLEQGWLARPAWVYLECAPGQDQAPLPESWEILRHKRAGDVVYRLVKRS